MADTKKSPDGAVPPFIPAPSAPTEDDREAGRALWEAFSGLPFELTLPSDFSPAPTWEALDPLYQKQWRQFADLAGFRRSPVPSTEDDREAAWARHVAEVAPWRADDRDPAAAERGRMYKAGWDAGWLARRSPVPPSAPTPDAAALIEEALIEFFRTRWRDGEVVKMLHYDGTLGREAAAHVAAALRVSAPETVITVEELDALPVGSVIMTTYDRGRSIERRVWQKFGQEPEWQFGMPRWEWQSTDGGFQRERAHSSIIGPAGFARVLFRPTREEGERP